MEADEVAMKVVEEEKIKKDEEALKNDASPMDTDILGSSTRNSPHWRSSPSR
jgi:hypothetical protein